MFDAGISTCPDPKSIVDGVKCPSDGAQCPGNPSSCDGATFYDAFQCSAGVWVTTAATVCGDGGYADAGSGPADVGVSE